MKNMTKKNVGILIIGIIAAVVVVNVVLGSLLANKKAQQSSVQATPTLAISEQPTETFSYKGEEGKTALAILKEMRIVEIETSGLVSGINGRKADSSKKEFWSFYVNGQMAQVGPAEYITKEGDLIEWKIETF